MELSKVEGLENLDFFGLKTREETRKERTLDAYEKAMKEGTVLNMTFSAVANNGLYIYENDVRVQLPAEEFGNGQYRRRALITKSYPVIVTSVDKDNKVITVSSRAIMNVAQCKYTEAIDASLASGEYFFTRVRVEANDKIRKRLIVNIAGVAIPGYIPIAEWSHTFIRSFDGLVNRGDIIEVAIIKKSRIGHSDGYMCSRKIVRDDGIWNNIEEMYPAKSNVVITCTSKTRNSWFGSIDGLQDIEVYCEYPNGGNSTDQKGRPLFIEVGGRYNCYIYKSNSEKRLLRARPLYQIS